MPHRGIEEELYHLHRLSRWLLLTVHPDSNCQDVFAEVEVMGPGKGLSSRDLRKPTIHEFTSILYVCLPL